MIDFLLRALMTYVLAQSQPDMSVGRARELAGMIVTEARDADVAPLLVAAVMWHESGFRNMPVNGSNDRGLMQVHWSPGAPWLHGLRPNDLMRQDVNIRAGVQELAWWRAHHVQHCRGLDHHWWAHYKWGYRVKDTRYGRAVRRKMAQLLL